MTKTFNKILKLIFEVIVFFIAQSYVRKFLGISQEVWFVIVYGISVLWFMIALWDFQYEILELFGIIDRFCQKKKEDIKRLVNSPIYLITSIIMLFATFGIILYKYLFYNDFMAKSNIQIVALVMIAYMIFVNILELITAEKEVGRKKITVALWIFIFLTNLSDFLR